MALIDIQSEVRADAAELRDKGSERFDQLAFALTFASAASIMVSIAASQILMGAALAHALLSGRRLRFPPVLLPLTLFFAMTIAADLLSADPRGGLPQMRKFYVYAIAMLVYTFFTKLQQIAGLVFAWSMLAAFSGIVGLQQFFARLNEAQRLRWNSIYEYVLDKRMTGFASHWMTFGGEQMIVLFMLASFLLFARLRRSGSSYRLKAFGTAAAVIIAISLLLGMTRSVYLAGAPAGLVWLLWMRRRSVVLSLPLVAAAMFLVIPAHIRERATSVIHPHGDVDSNGRRVIMARAGWEMIRSHPWLGIGPEQPGRQFERYVPAGVPRPLPKGWYGHLHNMYLQYAAERGVPALLFLLWAIAKAALDFMRAGRRANNQRRWILYGAAAVMIGVLVEGIFEHNLGDSEVLTMFLTVIGCGYTAKDVCA